MWDVWESSTGIGGLTIPCCAPKRGCVQTTACCTPSRCWPRLAEAMGIAMGKWESMDVEGIRSSMVGIVRRQLADLAAMAEKPHGISAEVDRVQLEPVLKDLERLTSPTESFICEEANEVIVQQLGVPITVLSVGSIHSGGARSQIGSGNGGVVAKVYGVRHRRGKPTVPIEGLYLVWDAGHFWVAVPRQALVYLPGGLTMGGREWNAEYRGVDSR